MLEAGTHGVWKRNMAHVAAVLCVTVIYYTFNEAACVSRGVITFPFEMLAKEVNAHTACQPRLLTASQLNVSLTLSRRIMLFEFSLAWLVREGSQR